MNATEAADESGQLLLIARHGQGHANADRTVAGPSCRGLTDTGRAQARGLARRLAFSADVTAIHFSTTLRARQTAQIIAARLRLNPHREPALRVPDPGEAEGMTWIEARRAWPADPLAPRRPRARRSEPWQTYLERAQRALERILAANPNGRVLVVGHTETLAAMVALRGNGTGHRFVRSLDFCAMTTWNVPRLPGQPVLLPSGGSPVVECASRVGRN